VATTLTPAPFATTVVFAIRNADGVTVRMQQADVTAATLARIVAKQHVVTIYCAICGEENSQCPDIARLMGA
jgi:hypothetical protein